MANNGLTPGVGIRTIKYFDKMALLKANNEAIAANVSQAVARTAIMDLPDDAKIPVYQIHPLNLTRYRLVLAMNMHGDIALLDCLRTTVDQLPTRRIRFLEGA